LQMKSPNRKVKEQENQANPTKLDS
jgi:hypothetical protein